MSVRLSLLPLGSPVVFIPFFTQRKKRNYGETGQECEMVDDGCALHRCVLWKYSLFHCVSEGFAATRTHLLFPFSFASDNGDAEAQAQHPVFDGKEKVDKARSTALKSNFSLAGRGNMKNPLDDLRH